MKKLVVGILAIIGVLSLLMILGVGLIGLLAATSEPGVPRDVILQVDFEQGVIEAIPEDPVAQMMLEDTTPVLNIVDALDKAAGDKRVKALVARIGGGGMGLAHVQEVRDAVIRFRESGKPAIAHAETFGEFGPGNGGYYLATAFDEIYLQPSGDVGLTGLLYESMFMAGTFEKLGVEPVMGQRYEYKNAMNSYTETEYTPAHREAMQALADSQFAQIVDGIAEARGMTEDEVRALFDAGPYLGHEAVDAGLIDAVMYEHEVYAQLEETLGDRTNLLFLDKYLERAGRPHTSGDTVALIHAYGTVVRGRSGYSPIDGSVVMGSESVVDAMRVAIDSDRVKAIILRVDSPGGSYVASDTIWRETVRAREAGKPVIVSMGNLAASGGYFVSMDADRIVAQPGTITGSIGVLGGKMLTTGFWEKVGLSWDDVSTSENATMFTGTHPYTEHGRARFDAWLDRVYEDFTSKVSEGRELPLERVREIAKGRIWTGADALELGLVDRLGGVHEAMEVAREELGLDPDDDIRIRRIPAKRTAFEMLFADKRDHRDTAIIAVLTQALREVQPMVRIAHQIMATERGELEVGPELMATP
jgi:protease-4